jgi:NADH-quinone oxidoreductase subunit L
MVELVWLIPMLPLAGFVVAVLFGSRLGEPWSGWVATLATAASFVVAVVVFAGLWNQPEHTYLHSYFTWIPAGSFHVDANVLLDPLSMTMILFITGIGSLIHLYSIGYMHGDPRFPRFFLYLNLFVFSMLVLVLGGNLLLTFLGWEGVGTCSYLLISFWFEKPANASAGKKAFVTNRVGDWGFMVAMFFSFLTFGSLNYSQILPQANTAAKTAVTVVAVMLFVGAIGKSAQIPLYIWLPDAMAGPTPVSALIHAATMVTAGVYLMCRINPLIGAADSWVPTLIAWVGAITALVAATIACSQMDLKKVLAFSTVSQLGYMFLAVGTGAYWAAVFHMVTHAFFKALLFLDSGSVIHGMHDEQDMRRMGGLRKYMPITAITMIIGWLAIAGIPPLSGFWSKDEILSHAFVLGTPSGYALWAVGTVAALLTAYYMTRLIFRTFYGDEAWRDVPVPEHDQTMAEALAALEPDQQAAALAVVPDLDLAFVPEPAHGHIGPDYEPHEAPWTMYVPLIVLSVGAALAGFLNLPFGDLNFLERWLEPVFANSGAPDVTETLTQTLSLLAVGAAVAVVGCLLGWVVWARRKETQRTLEPAVLGNGWYYDIAVTAFMGGPGRMLFVAQSWFDSVVVDGVVNGAGWLSIESAQVLRRMQSGYVRRYALWIAIGTLVMGGFVATKAVAG